MRNRQWHIYLGMFFAPMLIYFVVSGFWQVSRLNDLPKNEPPSVARRFFHEFSNPHRNAMLPGKDPKQDAPSVGFKVMTFLMSLGFLTTAFLGIQMGLQVRRRRKAVVICLLAGVLLPIVFLFLT